MIGAILAKRRVPQWFEAMNRHDLDALFRDYAPDVTMVYPEDVDGVSGTHNGKHAIRGWYQRYFEQFPQVHQIVKAIAVRDLFDMLGDNLIAVQWEAEVTNRQGLHVKNDGVSIVESRRGKAVNLRVYMSVLGDEFRRAWGVE